MIPLVVMTAALLYGPQTPEAERMKRLGELFEPRPGDLLPLDRLSYLENQKTPELIKGEIWIRPPKGQCILVRPHLDRKDLKICKPTPYPWKIDELDSLGRLRLNVMLFEDWDDGTFLTWSLPYRIGNFVAAGDADTGNFEDILIKTCEAKPGDEDEDENEERSIVLESFTGRRFKISLPEYDRPVLDVEPEIPNLLINVDSKKQEENKKEDGKEKEKGKEGDDKKGKSDEKKDEKLDPNAEDVKNPDAKTKPKGGGSVLGALLSGEYKEQLKPKVRWNIGARGAYRMESGRFSETGSPKGMHGECRYIFKNAPGDPESGAIECHNTDTMDSLYVHVPCFSRLKPKEDPKVIELREKEKKDKEKEKEKEKKGKEAKK